MEVSMLLNRKLTHYSHLAFLSLILLFSSASQLSYAAEVTATVDLTTANQNLLEAARYSDTERIAQLLKILGINVNYASNEGNTPLIWAAFNGKPAIVEQLLAVPGIDVNHVGSGGTNALHEAAVNGFHPIIQTIPNIARN